MMETPEERVLEACYQIAQANQVAEELEEHWGWLYNKQIISLDHGTILYEDYNEMLPFCIEVLTHSLKNQTSPNEIAFHELMLESVLDDRIELGDARITISNNREVLDAEAKTFNNFVTVYGIPGQHQVANAVLIGKWETKVRKLMKKTGSDHETATIALALGI